MKILSLIPRIMAVEPAVNWSGTKVQNTLFIYPFEPDFETRCLEAAQAHQPDLIIMFAFGEGPYCPDPQKIKLIKEKFPIVYIATDGACSGLWPTIRRFKQAQCFSAIVNIDGCFNVPPDIAAAIDLVTLSPLDQARYSYRRHIRDRSIALGFMGGEGARGTIRRDICDELIGMGILTRGQRNETWGSNPDYTNFMLDCRAVLNFPQTGLGKVHVKARALEAGLAGALLLEQAGSPLKHYATPGEDYFEWSSIEDIIKYLDMPLEDRAKMTYRFREKVLGWTDPDIWVQKVMRVVQHEDTLFKDR